MEVGECEGVEGCWGAVGLLWIGNESGEDQFLVDCNCVGECVKRRWATPGATHQEHEQERKKQRTSSPKTTYPSPTSH